MKIFFESVPLSNSRVIKLTFLVQSLIILVLVILNLIIQSYLMLGIVCAYYFLNLINYLVFWKNKNFNIWSNVFILLGSIDVIFLFYNGGNFGSGVMWTFVFPFLIFYLKGYKKGLIFTTIFYSILLLIFLLSLFGNGPENKTGSFMVIFFIIHLTISIFLYYSDKNRTLSELLLQESENRFRIITELTNAGVYIFQKGHFVKFNKAFIDLVGFSEDEIKEIKDLKYAHPEYREYINERMQKRNKGEKGIFRNEMKIVTKDGNIRWVEHVTDSITLDGSMAIVGTMFDITDRKLNEDILLRKANFQKLIVDFSARFINSTPESINSTIDDLLKKCGQFLNVDRFFIYKLSSDQTKVVNSNEWCADGITNSKIDYLQILQICRNAFNTIYIPDFDLYKFDDNVFGRNIFESNIRSVLILPMIKNDKVLGVFGFMNISSKKEVDEEILKLLFFLANIITDATEKNQLDLKLRETSLELEQLNMTKDKLFSIIAHDLRSPFNSFIGFTDIMSDNNSEITLQEMRGYSKLLNQLAVISFELLENLLDWSRLQRGLLKLEPNTVNVSEFVKDAISSYEERVSKRNQLVRILIDPDLKAVLDKRMIETVIRNIFANAIKFTPDGGLITINASLKNNKHIEICISDTGIGIPAKLLPILFSVNDEKSRPGINGEKSSGIGLMLCKEFVELHKGRIWVESKEFSGSKFCIELPQPFPDATSLL